MFGGVQVVSNICSVVLNKLVAVWIGPAGMGMFSIFNSAIDMLRSGTSLGLRTSAVRDIAMAHGSGDAMALSRIVVRLYRSSMGLRAAGMRAAFQRLCQQ